MLSSSDSVPGAKSLANIVSSTILISSLFDPKALANSIGTWFGMMEYCIFGRVFRYLALLTVIAFLHFTVAVVPHPFGPTQNTSPSLLPDAKATGGPIRSDLASTELASGTSISKSITSPTQLVLPLAMLLQTPQTLQQTSSWIHTLNYA